MRSIRVVTCCALVIVSTPLMPANAQVPDLTTIDVQEASFTLPRGINSEALAINPQGDIVGQYSAGGTNHGFLMR